jgi:flavin-dependent dehydrogenase
VQTFDVVIMGAGIAGGFLARQLKRTRPELEVLVLEASEKMTDWKVGESTVEVAANYMIRRLGLGTYLYQHQLPKNGLRFFFDSPEKDLPLPEMSEIGSDHMPFHPSFQLERAALERDLCVMNTAAGVDVRLGAKVVQMAVAEGGGTPGGTAARHTVVFEKDGARHEVSCRWLIDASGRRHLLSRALGRKIQKETRLNTGAAWARYRNVAGLDSFEDPAWRGRVRWTSRHLSTNHMMYDGYWLWFIPLAGDLMSVGAVYDKDRIGEGPKNAAAFEAFMKSHRSSRDLLEGAELEDFQQYGHLPYWSERYFSGDRWALTGFAGAFTDPFYSPGSDFIATANEFITALIVSDLDGETARFQEQLELFNAFYRLKYESVLRLYARLYPIFGSWEIYRLKYLLDFNNYYNLVVWPFKNDLHLDLDWLRRELEFGDLQLKAQSAMADHFVRLGEHLRKTGAYHAQNTGRWANGLNGVVQFEKRLDSPVDGAFRRQQVDKLYGGVFAAVLERLASASGVSDRQRVVDELSLPHVVVLREIDETTLDRFLGRVAGSLARDLRKEFPGAGALSVELRAANGAGPVLRVRGADGGDAEPEVLARAEALWSVRADSVAHHAL